MRGICVCDVEMYTPQFVVPSPSLSLGSARSLRSCQIQLNSIRIGIADARWGRALSRNVGILEMRKTKQRAVNFPIPEKSNKREIAFRALSHDQKCNDFALSSPDAVCETLAGQDFHRMSSYSRLRLRARGI